MSHFGDKRGVLNGAEMSVVCNACATYFRVTLDFPAVFGYANVNRIQQYTIQTPRGVVWPPRTDVLGGFCIA